MKPLTSHRAHKAGLHFPSLVTLSVAVISQFATPSAFAADLTWSGGNGVWTNAVAGGWSAAWSNSNDTATFTGAGGIVTLTTDITVRTGVAGTNLTSLRFNGTGDYTLSAGSALTLTLNTNSSGSTSTPATRAISVLTGRTATVGANVTITTASANRNQVISGADLASKLVIESGGTIKGNGTAIANILSLNDITVEVKTGGTLTTTATGVSGTALFVNGDLKVLGGTVTALGTLGLGQGTGTLAGNLTLTATGGSITAPSVNGIRFGSTSTTDATAGGTIHLDGGTLSAFRIFKGGNLVTTSVLNLNGGLLKATAMADGTNVTTAPNFIEGLGRANVRNGGAKIDSAGFNLVVTQDLLHSDNVLDNATDGGLTKSGLGTLTLTGNNTYTGETVIKAGTLKANTSTTLGSSSKITVGDTGSSGTVLDATAAGLTVGATQTLAGIGSVNATGQTVTITGTLAPGNSPGTLSMTVGTLDLGNATALAFELNPTDTTVGSSINDLVAVTGNLNLDGILSMVATSGNFLSVAASTSWRLFNYTGTLTDDTLSMGTMPSLGSGLSWSIDTATTGQVNLVVIPEPNVAALLGGLGMLTLLRRRRN